MTRALIVDDERLARSDLRRLLSVHPEIAIVGEACDANEADRAIESLRPDLVFLDVQMPGRNGFELLRDLAHPPAVIFTTAHDEHALRAFSFGALDYLLKPIESDRLAQSLRRLSNAIPVATPADDVVTPPISRLGPSDQVFIKDGDRCWFVRAGEIQLVEADGEYSRVFFRVKEMALLARSLNYLEERLSDSLFFRASRQHLVNLTAVTRIEAGFGGALILKLADGRAIEVSRRRSQLLRERMSL